MTEQEVTRDESRLSSLGLTPIKEAKGRVGVLAKSFDALGARADVDAFRAKFGGGQDLYPMWSSRNLTSCMFVFDLRNTIGTEKLWTRGSTYIMPANFTCPSVFRWHQIVLSPSSSEPVCLSIRLHACFFFNFW